MFENFEIPIADKNDDFELKYTSRNPEWVNSICQMAKDGKTTKEIAKHLQRSVGNISKILRKQGVKPAPAPNLLKGVSTKPKKIAAVCEMAKSGKTKKEIAEHFKITHSRVCEILKEKGIIVPRSCPNYNPERIKQICDMFKNGKTIAEIYHHFKFTGSSWIYQILWKFGLKNKNINVKRADGRVDMKAGYLGIRIPNDDPLFCMCTKSGVVLEHRYVMAKSLGRPLNKNETVHHKNGIKEDNRLENLQLRQGHHGSGVAVHCADCGSDNIETIGYYAHCRKCQSTKIKFANI